MAIGIEPRPKDEVYRHVSSLPLVSLEHLGPHKKMVAKHKAEQESAENLFRELNRQLKKARKDLDEAKSMNLVGWIKNRLPALGKVG